MKNLWVLFLVGLSTGLISEKLVVLSQATNFQQDDLYIEEPGSGDLPVDDEDGDDYGSGSGSGSGDYGLNILSDEDDIINILNFTKTSIYKEVLPLPVQPTVGFSPNPPTTASDPKDPEPTAEDTHTSLSDDRDESVEIPGGPTVYESLITSATPVSSTTDFILNEMEDLIEEKSIDTVESEAFPNNGRDSRRHGLNSPQEVTSENLWERTEVLAAVIACGVVGFLCAVSLLLLLAYRMKKKDEGSYVLGDTKMSATAYHKAPTKEFYA
ncbi:syndecan-2-like [Cyprinodon tularosa]|uniref:syndecan-2-like n=1 Tax=Cyprinodon tularosa TaxID=77115 RepID=UPI0018E2332A|nr:syndecan-2-like [Cyprinodon tularosa]